MKPTFRQIIPWAAAALLLCACATQPTFKLDDVDKAIAPSAVLADINTYRGKKVLWGGVIVNSQNLKKGTLLEILAYPLDSAHEPVTGKAPYGRFLAEDPEYLETVDYAAGRAVTLVGIVSETREGRIGEAEYNYPVVAIEQLHLWPTPQQQSDSRFHFGIGVMISN